jgi:hypothetical protein
MGSVIRGCGSRKKGGIYAEVPLSPFGSPFEHFLFDPPVKVDLEAMGLSPIGVKLLKRPDEDVYDVYDIIGADSYPNVLDFIEEAKRFGISRRLSSRIDFSLLTEKSKLIVLHSRAFIENAGAYWPEAKFKCPKAIQKHEIWEGQRVGDDPLPMCIGLWGQDIEDGNEHPENDPGYIRPSDDPRFVLRTMPSFSYEGYRRPDGVTPEYSTAIFGSFHLGRLVVINDPDDKTHEPALAKAKAAQIPVESEDE